jgi:tubulin-folding cofactor B
VSEIEKWEMPKEQYEKRTDSVRAWKERNQLGRFDPLKDQKEAEAHERLWREVTTRGIKEGMRCRVGGEDGRRGVVRYVGEIPEIPNGGLWIGFEADEPTGMGSFPQP